MIFNINQVLAKVSLYLRLDINYIGRNGLWLVLMQFTGAVSGIILSIFFANLFPRETFGIFKYITSVLGIISIFTLTGLNTAIARGIARNNISKANLKDVVKKKVKWGFIGSFICLGIAFYYFTKGNTMLTGVFTGIAFLVPFFETFTVFTSVLIGKKLFKSLSFYSILINFTTTATLLIFLFLTNNLFLILLAYLLSLTLLRFLTYKLVLKKVELGHESNTRSLILYGKHLSIINFFDTVAMRLDSLLLFYYLGAANLAIYSFATLMPENIKGILKNVNPLALPIFSQQSKENLQDRLFSNVLKMTLFSVVVVSTYIVFAPFIFKLIFPVYLDSVLYSQVYMLSLIPAAAVLPYSVLEAHAAKKELYIYRISASMLQIILLIIFTFLYGIWGIIISRIAYRFFNLGISLWLVKKF